MRGYPGQAMGGVLVAVMKVKTVGMVTNDSSICASLTGATAGQIISRSPARDPIAAASIGQPEDAARAYQNIKDKEAVALIFGGQTAPEQNFALLRASLKELARADYPGAIYLVAQARRRHAIRPTKPSPASIDA